MLGPWWITITMAALISGLTLLNTQLFNVSVRDYLPWVAVGFLTWGFVSSCLIEGSDTFIAATGMLRQAAIPMMVFVWRVLMRNIIYFAHNFVAIAAAAILLGFWKTVNVPFTLIGLALILANVSWAILLLGIISARFRDIPQIVTSMVQFVLFMTPVFWLPGNISRHRYILDFNPFYYLLDALRSPMIGAPLDHRTLPVLASAALIGWLTAFAVFTATRRRIVHFL